LADGGGFGAGSEPGELPVARLQPNGYPLDKEDLDRSYLLFLGPAYGGTVGGLLVATSAFVGIVEVQNDHPWSCV